MEFLYKPVNPFQDDGLSKEDRAMIDGMRNTAYVCGYRGGDVEFAVNNALKRMGRYDLLPPCEQESGQESGGRNMQIVIDIPDEIYERFGYEYREENLISKHTNDIILDAFCNGIPLPKGHGDLKDSEKLKHAFIVWSMAVQGNYTDADIASIIYNSPIIIEADKAESEEDK